MSTDLSPQHDFSNRRDFLLLTAAALVATGCESVRPGANPPAGNERVIDAGPASAYATDGVYSQYRSLGFFVVRRGRELTALSSICTHRHCKIEAEPDRSFYCPCHDSTFTPEGKVTQGPAVRDLPVYVTSIDAQGHLLVKITA